MNLSPKRMLINVLQSFPKLSNSIWELVFPFFFNTERVDEGYQGSMQSVFSEIHENDLWGSQESKSGPGSGMTSTINLRHALPKIIGRYNITSVLDAPCGDANWVKSVNFPSNISYIGADIVSALITNNKSLSFATLPKSAVKFYELDIVEGSVPQVDLWMCRDVMFHLPNAANKKIIENFLESGSQYFLATTHRFVKCNVDVQAGGFRYINLQKPPYDFPTPIQSIQDFLLPHPPRRIALWSREQLVNHLTGGY